MSAFRYIIAEGLTHRLATCGLTMNQLLTRMNMSGGIHYRFLKGRPAKWGMVVRFAIALGVEPNSLIDQVVASTDEDKEPEKRYAPNKPCGIEFVCKMLGEDYY